MPVRDEAGELPRLFAALDALTVPGGVGPVAVCLLLDGCTDASLPLARGYAARSRRPVRLAEAAPHPLPNAGRARAAAMALGLGWLAEAGADATGLLLSTDADSAPDPGWLAAMAAGLRAADVVAGRVRRAGGPPCPLQDRVERYYDALFGLRRRLDPVAWEAPATHHQAGGANLGFRAAAYRRLGGFRPLASGEDARALDDAARAGLRVRRDAACRVETSARRRGRAAGGLAATLERLDAGAAGSVEVAHPGDAAWQYRGHALARAAWGGPTAGLAAALGLAPGDVAAAAAAAPNAEAFAMRVVPAPPGGMRPVALPAAEAALAALLAERAAA